MPRRIGRAALIDQEDEAGGGDGSAQALLDEAAVRFDFSQYTEVNDMVDVNGGWGPLVSNFQDTFEFNATGLHFTGNEVHTTMAIESVPGPLTFGPNGLTIVSVVRNDAAFDVIAPGVENSIHFVDLFSDYADAQAPQINVMWRATQGGGEDTYGITFIDVAPGYEAVSIIDQSSHPSGLDSSLIAAGVFIQVAVLDVAAGETRVTLASPDDRFDVTVPFDKAVPDFAADPRTIDTISYGGTAVPDDHTVIEWLGWNRVLTEAEVDALAAHFTG